MQTKKTKSNTEIRFALYDSFGKFVGYKTDSQWTLSKQKRYAKVHDLSFVSPSSHLLTNLLFFVNMPEYIQDRFRPSRAKLDDKGSIYVVAEEIETGKGLAGLAYKKDEKGKYQQGKLCYSEQISISCSSRL